MLQPTLKTHLAAITFGSILARSHLCCCTLRLVPTYTGRVLSSAVEDGPAEEMKGGLGFLRFLMGGCSFHSRTAGRKRCFLLLASLWPCFCYPSCSSTDGVGHLSIDLSPSSEMLSMIPEIQIDRSFGACLRHLEVFSHPPAAGAVERFGGQDSCLGFGSVRQCCGVAGCLADKAPAMCFNTPHSTSVA